MDIGVVDDHVPAILEGIVAVLAPVADTDIVGVHEKIIGMADFYILDVDVRAVPESLLSVGDAHIAERYPLELAEHFRSFDKSVGHEASTAVPQGRAGSLGENAVCDFEPVDMPKRIFSLETAIVDLDVPAVFQGAFSGMYRTVLKTEVLTPEQGALAAEFFVLYGFHVNSVIAFNVQI